MASREFNKDRKNSRRDFRMKRGDIVKVKENALQLWRAHERVKFSPLRDSYIGRYFKIEAATQFSVRFIGDLYNNFHHTFHWPKYMLEPLKLYTFTEGDTIKIRKDAIEILNCIQGKISTSSKGRSQYVSGFAPIIFHSPATNKPTIRFGGYYWPYECFELVELEEKIVIQKIVEEIFT